MVRKLREERGEVAPQMAIILLVGVMLFSAAFQVHHAYAAISMVKENAKAAALSVAAINGDEIFEAARESSWVARHYDAEDWETSVYTEDMIESLSHSLGADRVGNTLVKGDSLKMTDLSITYLNIEGGQLNFTFTATAEVPLTFGGSLLPPLRYPLTVKTTYEPKF